MDSLPALVNYIAGAATGLVIALVLAWVDRRWRRQDVRAAEKRARLEEGFKPMRRYAAALREFVHDCLVCMDFWEENGADEDRERLPQILGWMLEKRRTELETLKRRSDPWSRVRDLSVKAPLLGLEEGVNECHDRCNECLEAGELMSRLQKDRFSAQADENLDKLLRRMEKAVEKVEG